MGKKIVISNGSKKNPIFNEVLALPAKVVLANYVVRIYRFDRKKPRRIVGFVEEVGGKGKKAFTNYDELWEILSSSKSIKHQEKKEERG